MSPRHRLAAIWFADIVDFSRLAEADEDAALAAVHRLQQAAHEVASRHHGRVVKHLGDGVLVEFDSSENAVRAACRLLDALEDGGPDVRVGVHVGDVAATEDGDLYGSGVNVAARISDVGPVGGVAVSEDVQRQIRQRSAFRFDDLGEHDLKGVGSIALYGVTVDPDAEVDESATAIGEPGGSSGSSWLRRRGGLVAAGLVAALALGVAALVTVVRDGGRAPAVDEAAAGTAAPGIAVMPFEVTGSELGEWREGMVDLLSTNLDGVEGLRAIESGTVMARWSEVVGSGEAGATAQLRVARRARARYAVLGRVVGIGDGVRLSASLYDVETGERIGQSRVDGSIEEVWELVDRLTVELLGHLGETEEGRALIDLAGVTTGSLEALKAYLEGESRFRRSDFAGAAEAFKRAVEIDSTFALAHVRRAQAVGWGALGPEDDPLRAASRHADRLRARDRRLLRGTLLRLEGSLDAIPHLVEATRLYPEDPDAWFQLGEAYYHLGRQALIEAGRSEEPFERAVEIDARLSPAYMHPIENAFGLHADSARARRLVDAFERNASGAIETRLYRLGWSLAFGDEAEARGAMDAVDTLDARMLRFVARNLFWHPSLLILHERLLTRPPRGEREPFALAVVHLRMGRVEAAVRELTRPAVPVGRRLAYLYQARAWGAPVEAAALTRAASAVGPRDPVAAFFVGAHAADEGRWDEHRSVVDGLLRVDRRRDDAGASRFAHEAARALRAYGAWRRGEEVGVADTLAAVQRVATGTYETADEALYLREEVNATIRLWLAELAREVNDVDDELLYLESFWGKRMAFANFADHRRAGVLERAGREDAARRLSDRVGTAWSEADPEIAAWLEDGTEPRAGDPAR